MQTVKNFVYGKDLAESVWNGVSIELQINEYLKSHPECSVAALSMLSGAGYKEALVVFNIREERPEKDIRRQNKQDINSISTKDYKNQGRINTTVHSNEKP